jgi:glutaredoxin-like YruB-family protein
MANKTVKIYSTPTCHYCNIAKDFFKEKGVKYEEYNVSTDLAKRKEMVEISGQMGVPVIDIGGDIVVGFDEVEITKLLGL